MGLKKARENKKIRKKNESKMKKNRYKTPENGVSTNY